MYLSAKIFHSESLFFILINILAQFENDIRIVSLNRVASTLNRDHFGASICTNYGSTFANSTFHKSIALEWLQGGPLWCCLSFAKAQYIRNALLLIGETAVFARNAYGMRLGCTLCNAREISPYDFVLCTNFHINIHEFRKFGKIEIETCNKIRRFYARLIRHKFAIKVNIILYRKILMVANSEKFYQ